VVELKPTKWGHVLQGREPVIFHCHHFNLYLQQTILDARNFGKTPDILRKVAESVAYSALSSIGGKDERERRKIAEEVFKQNGFGLLDLSDVKEKGGTAYLPQSHFGRGYILREERKADEPQCFFARGFIQGALSFIYEKKPGSYIAEETNCIALGHDRCKIQVELIDLGIFVESSNGFDDVKMIEPDIEGKWGNIKPKEIYNAMAQLKLAGNEEGLIPAFGVLLTNMYANWYNFISFKTAELIKDESRNNLAYDLFVESGHVCAFNTFGGIMESAEWDALVKPMIKTREDWIYGMVAIVNCLGWGTWLVEELKPGEYIRVRAYNSYEQVGFRTKYNLSNDTTCWLLTGAVAGLMNLLYKGDITKKPKLDREFYEFLFRTGKMFIGREVQCASQGAPYCVVEAEWHERK
jgi:predicted hydrocarbon binding protein